MDLPLKEHQAEAHNVVKAGKGYAEKTNAKTKKARGKGRSDLTDPLPVENLKENETEHCKEDGGS